MKNRFPKKIAIIGLPGSGKSTFAIELARILDIPLHHLDGFVFEPNGKKKNRQELLAIEQAIVNEASWIIEGCSMSTLETRFARADTVIYFQFSRSVCMWRICKRLFNYNKTLTKTGCIRFPNWKLLKYVWTFEKEKDPIIKAFKTQHPGVNFFIFKNSKDASQFIDNFKEQ